MLRAIIFLSCIVSMINAGAQRSGQPVFVSLSQMPDEYFVLTATEPTSKSSLPCTTIRFIDNRSDTARFGFFPVYKRVPKSIRLNDELPAWMQVQFGKLFTKNETAERQLLIAVQKFWFSPEAFEKFSLLKQKLQIALYYNLEVYSVVNSRYFAIKRFEGNFRTIFNEESAYQALTDSLFTLLKQQLPAIDYTLRESKGKPLDSTQVFQYFNDKKKNIQQNFLRRGVYASYDDFIQQKIIGDSVEIVKSYDYYQMRMVGCNLGVYVQGGLQSCSKCWGYFDGRYLFVNTGNGFFMRLRSWNNQFVLADLQEIAMQSIHKSATSDVIIGNTSFENIKDFAKTYRLFYQLNYDDGRLF
ncbi:MAG: hypothetical protein ACHQEB_07365 [Chitinophagales bacterium]